MESTKQPPRLEKPVRITEQTWPEGTVPVVSVVCITYNHEKFIREAIEGFLMQETTFPVEIFVHDDASTDGTVEIVKEYATKHPQLFWTVFQNDNQWSKGNRRILFEYLAKQRGEFVAMCEGDDYWTNSAKLETQARRLIESPSASAVFHWTEDELPDGRKQPPPASSGRDWGKGSVTVAELLERNVITTCSALFRTAGLQELPPQCAELPMGDWPLWIHLAAQGSFVCHPERMAVYRLHGEGQWSKLSPAAQLLAAGSMLATLADKLPTDLRECALQSFEKYIRWASLRLVPSCYSTSFRGTVAHLRHELACAGLSESLPLDFLGKVKDVTSDVAMSFIGHKANKAWEHGSYTLARRHYRDLAFGSGFSLRQCVRYAFVCTGCVGLWVKRTIGRLKSAAT